MSEPKRLNGFWWLPGAPQQRWFGTLTQDGRSIELCCFTEQDVPNPESMPQTFTLHGMDESGKPVTLLIADWTSINRSGSMKKIQLRSAYALVGVHVDSKDDLRANHIFLDINHLHEWLGMTGFRRNLNGRIGKDRFEVTIPYTRPDPVEVTLQDGTTIAFCVNANYKAAIEEHRIAESSTVCISRKEGFSFDQIWDMTEQFRKLLHFAVLKPVYAESMTLQQDAHGEHGDARTIQVWSLNLRSVKPSSLYGRQFTFRFKDVAPTFADFYKRWLEFAGKYDEALGCYTTTVYHKPPSTVELLCLTQALDAYHGIRHNSHKDPNLRKKVQDIICSIEPYIIGLIEDDTEFSECVRVTRNYYTHHNPKLLEGGKVAQGRDLIRMNEKLKLLFQSCVLQFLGVPHESGSALKRQIATTIIEY